MPRTQAAQGPSFGQVALPERTVLTAVARAQGLRESGTVIEHAEAALISWLSDRLDVKDADVGSTRPDGDSQSGGARAKAELRLWYLGIAERNEGRTDDPVDVRDATGRVVERQRATRLFEVDYWCALSGGSTATHRALGQLVQTLVDEDVVPGEHVPGELADLGVPLEIRMSDSPRPAPDHLASVLGVSVQIVVPFRPTAERLIASPVTDLHLDVGPPPEPVDWNAAVGNESTDDVSSEPKVWKSVRRTEAIARPARSTEKVN